MKPTDRDKIKALTDNGMKFRDACLLLGLTPENVEIVDDTDTPDFIKDLFKGFGK
jgi:hypothetical protein